MSFTPRVRIAICTLATFSVPYTAAAATYYVDASNGRDTNSGAAAQNSSAGIGPWRSLSKVASAKLLPGDTVYLACGQRWSETLRVTASGTSSLPIKFDSWPTGCANKPVIDGSVAISDTAWASASGGSWSTAWPPSVLGNGAFDGSSLAPWSGWSDTKAEVLSTASDCPNGSTRCGQLSFKTSLKQAMAISNSFSLDADHPVTVRLAVKLPVGHSATLTVRRHAAPWDDLGLAKPLTGTGAWQTLTYTFTPKEKVDNARLDFMLGSGNGPLVFDDVKVVPALGSALAVHIDEVRQTPAHHPNAGHLAAEPTSPYLRLTNDSATFTSGNASVSSTAHLDTSKALPSGGSIAAGLGVSIRTRAWLLEEFQIGSYSGGIAALTTNASVSLLKNWGYFLTGAAWMVDSPSEWFADADAGTGTGTLRLRTHDAAAPGKRVRVTWLPAAIDLQNTSYVSLSNLAVRNVGDGVLLGNSTGASLQNLSISHTRGYGIDMVSSKYAVISDSQLSDTRLDAIAGSRTGKTSAQYAQVLRNSVRGSGVPSDPSAPDMLPAPVRAAIHAGQYALVDGNTLERIAYVGIRGDKGSTITHNVIDSSCMLFDDGGGIYIKDTGNNGIVTRNTIRDVFGNTNGKPPGEPTQAVGIYLDDWTSGVTMSGNTVVNADHGIQVHNAYGNTISGNTLYANRVNQLWMQENEDRYRAGGDIHSNTVIANTMVPPGTQAAVYHVSEFEFPEDFASYDGNIYSTLLSPLVAVETWQDTSTSVWITSSYTLDQWQQAIWQGTARTLDANGVEISPKAFAQYEIIGDNLVRSTVADTADGWRGWNSGDASWSIGSTTCPIGWCFVSTAGVTDTIISSPRFAIVKDQWYRLSFDLKAPSGEKIEFMVRRGGGGENGYESLMGAKRSVSGSGAWTRHSLTFKADKSINIDDPVTLDTGARIDFGWLKPGLNLSVGNVQLVPISAVDEVTRLALLTNPGDTDAALDCPNIDSEPDLCSRYVTFTTQETVTWPRSVAAHSSEVIFTRALELVDSDGDGIADSQDSCATTPAGAAVDATGCPL